MRIRCMATRITLAVSLILSVAGCVQERSSENTPIHINPNMDNQPKYRPQSESKFFADGSTMRVPDTATVALGELHDNTEYYTGKNTKGELIPSLPDTVELNRQLLDRGQERFNIYCTPCHGGVGDGQGIVVTRGYVAPPTFHSDRLRELPDGHIFDVITNGKGNMPAYRFQIPVNDRWAIVAYFRTLQQSQNAGLDDVPPPVSEKVK